ncbi:MAG: glycosyltransferase [Lachnospiraceae bacterium]
MSSKGSKKRKIKLVKDRVSAVIPVFNGETYLSSMLESMLDQTYSQIEVIVVDDGSIDGTVAVAEGYYERFRAKGYDYRIVRAMHRNASAAINCGLPYVTGEYLIWPDSDDRLEKESVEKRVKFLQKNSQYQCVRSLAYYFDQRTQEIVPADESIGELSKEDLFWDILESKTFVCCGCYMLKTEKFFEIYPQKHIPEYDVGQNFQMLLPFMYYYKCPTIPEQLYGVCVRQGSHSRTGLTEVEEKKKYQDYEDLIDEIVSLCHIEDKESIDRMKYWKISRRYLLAMKYKDVGKLIVALYQIRQYGKEEFHQAFRDLMWKCINIWSVQWKKRFQ